MKRPSDYAVLGPDERIARIASGRGRKDRYAGVDGEVVERVVASIRGRMVEVNRLCKAGLPRKRAARQRVLDEVALMAGTLRKLIDEIELSGVARRKRRRLVDVVRSEMAAAGKPMAGE